MPKIALYVCAVLLSLAGMGQDRVVTVGFQVKPIVPSNLFGTGTESVVQNGIKYTLSQGYGYAMGMSIRKGFHKRFSVETGINFARRNYSFSIAAGDSLKTDRFSVIGYELPVSGLMYVRLGEQVYMNVSVGAALDFFPSNVGKADYYYDNLSLRNSWLQTSGVVNLGWEWRTEESGIFYIGATYKRFVTPIYRTRLRVKENLVIHDEAIFELSGNYLTLDLRYYFHENPEKRESRKGKKKNKGQFRQQQ